MQFNFSTFSLALLALLILFGFALAEQRRGCPHDEDMPVGSICYCDSDNLQGLCEYIHDPSSYQKCASLQGNYFDKKIKSVRIGHTENMVASCSFWTSTVCNGKLLPFYGQRRQLNNLRGFSNHFEGNLRSFKCWAP
jgi:hypothetical protein